MYKTYENHAKNTFNDVPYSTLIKWMILTAIKH